LPKKEASCLKKEHSFSRGEHSFLKKESSFSRGEYSFLQEGCSLFYLGRYYVEQHISSSSIML
jgi:hypothetical protein